jgi:putative heme transporter
VCAGRVAAIVVLVAIIVYQELESRLVVPRVYGQTLRLSPVAVTIALLAGGKLLGIIGALLALPIAAGIRVLVEDLRIDLPGEQPGEVGVRTASDRAETLYADRADGVSLDEAAAIATQVAETLEIEETGTVADVTRPIGSASPRVEG